MRIKFQTVFLAAVMAVSYKPLFAAPNPQPSDRPGPGPGMGLRDNPKFKLTGLIRNVGRLEEDKKTALSKDQAKRFVLLIKPWFSKPKMSDNEAKALTAKGTGILNANQKKALEAFAAERRGFGGGPGGPGGPGGRDGRGPGDGGGRGEGRGPGGGGGRGEGGGRFGGGPGGPGGGGNRGDWEKDREKFRVILQTYNPLYPPAKSPLFKQIPERMQERMSRRYQDTVDLISKLEKKAK